MNTLIKNLYSLLPQNTQVQRKLEIESEVKKLQAAIQNKSGDVFKKIISETGNQFHKDLQLEKEKCLNSLARLNGNFFQDPNSQMKKAWDSIVKEMNSIGIKIEKQDQLDAYENNLKQMDGNRAPVALLAIEKTNSKTLQTTLKSTKQNLEKRQKVLCGNYYQDPKGKLDIAWKAYTTALSSGDNSAAGCLETFNKLDNRRKSNEAKLFEIEKQIRITTHRTFSIEVLAEAIIKEQIKELEEAKNKESSDWKSIARKAYANVLSALNNPATYKFLN